MSRGDVAEWAPTRSSCHSEIAVFQTPSDHDPRTCLTILPNIASTTLSDKEDDQTEMGMLSLDEPLPPKTRDDFTIAIFCALPFEAEVVDAFFSKRWKTSDYGKQPGDKNTYTLGAISGLNVVLVHLGGMGKLAAAIAAAGCYRSFPRVQLALVVGICGGVPSDMGENGMGRVLGDVVIGDTLFQYDYGMEPSDLKSMGRPVPELRSFLSKLRGRRILKQLHESTWRYLDALQDDKVLREGATYPGATRDALYESPYIHKHWEPQACRSWSWTCGTADGSCDEARESSCEALGCDHGRLVARHRLQQAESSDAASSSCRPMIHIGSIASGDTLLKSGQHRDRIAESENILAFEMEGAGIWNCFPCLVIKGICDYADSHKNKDWQSYAAAAAASCMAAFLDEWARNQ